MLTYETAAALLHPKETSTSTSAEEKRPWARRWAPALRQLLPGSVLDELWDCVLMRTYDGISGSLPDHNCRMLARDAEMRLDKEEKRKETLSNHSNHSIWKPTPYISFTKSPQDLEILANWRATRERGDQQIVVVDPQVRFELHLPILRYSEELEHYSINPAYHANYWHNHYLCLWEVTPQEVVGVWQWNHLKNKLNWYDEVVMPAVQRYRENRRSGRSTLGDRQPLFNGESGLSDSSDDADDGHYSSDSDGSYERTYEEDCTRPMIKMYEDLKLD